MNPSLEHCVLTMLFTLYVLTFRLQFYFFAIFFCLRTVTFHRSVCRSAHQSAARPPRVRVDNFFFSSWAMKLVTRTEKNSKRKLCTQLLIRDVRQKTRKKLKNTEQNRANWEIWTENVSTRRNPQSKGHLMAWQS